MIGEKVSYKKLMTLENDGHYQGYLINGSRITDYFGDISGELMTRATGNGSMLRAYKEINFLAPVWVGDLMEYTGWIEKKNNTSYELHFEAYKLSTKTDDYKVKNQFNHGSDHPDLKGYEGNLWLDPPILCGNAIGIFVVPEKDNMGPLDPKFAIPEEK